MAGDYQNVPKGRTGGYNPRTVDEDTKEIMDEARKHGQEIQDIARQVADAVGGRVTPLNLKKADSIKRKAAKDELNPKDLTDTARTTIVVDNEEQLAAAVAMMQNSGATITKYTNQTPQKYGGYSGHLFNIEVSGKFVGEIQINTARMIYAKEPMASAVAILGKEGYLKARKESGGAVGGAGHRFYEQTRSKRYENGKINKESNAVTDRQINREVERQKAYYRNFRSGKK